MKLEVNIERIKLALLVGGAAMFAVGLVVCAVLLVAALWATSPALTLGLAAVFAIGTGAGWWLTRDDY